MGGLAGLLDFDAADRLGGPADGPGVLAEVDGDRVRGDVDGDDLVVRGRVELPTFRFSGGRLPLRLPNH